MYYHTTLKKLKFNCCLDSRVSSRGLKHTAINSHLLTEHRIFPLSSLKRKIESIAPTFTLSVPGQQVPCLFLSHSCLSYSRKFTVLSQSVGKIAYKLFSFIRSPQP